MILVIKLSGKVLEEREWRRDWCRQIGALAASGERLVIVHGGGKQLTELSTRLGIPVVQHEGRRVTDKATLEVAKMVLSALNRDLTAELIAAGTQAVGIAGLDAKLVRCRRRPPIPVRVDGEIRQVDFGLVGEIEAVNPSFLLQLWELRMVPVISCLCADGQGQILNINADTLAAELAAALGADHLVSISDVDGIYWNPQDASTRIPQLTVEDARRHLREGRFTDGMIPKVESALKVLGNGVASVLIASGLSRNGLLDGLKGESGTRMVQSSGYCSTARGGRTRASSFSRAWARRRIFPSSK